MKFTILGISGFIGGALVTHLTAKGFEVYAPDREISSLSGKNLGHVIYAIGLTGNFREHPDKAIEAHVTHLQTLMKNAVFDSWLYLSSARVYQGSTQTDEDATLSIKPSADSLYDLTKLLGESICLSYDNPAVRIARLSNVYGTGQSRHTFLGNLLQSVKETGECIIQESPKSSKDYIAIDDVCRLLALIALNGKNRIYNVASGYNLTHAELAQYFNQSGYRAYFSPSGEERIFPVIDINRIKKEFSMKPQFLKDDFPNILKDIKREMI